MSPKSYLSFLTRLRKKFISLVAVIILGLLLINNPNPLTHKCVPNFRTQLGLSSEGYPYDKGFCPDGQYPVLKWGQEDAVTRSVAELFFVVVPLLILTPLIFIYLAHRKNNGS